MQAGHPSNRLIDATSPYLLQHAHNPVDWYSWSPEALERARRENRPILLSVGYAACHWCHVMAHESFEDAETAAVMNEHFVNVKVDREERPDLDAIYMEAVQAMTGQGGWPMTVFLTPDCEPFLAGTYFPPEDRMGLPGFRRLLLAVAEMWHKRPQELRGQGRQVTRALGAGAQLTESAEPLTPDIVRGATRQLARSFDREWGGFGSAPKFPQPMTLEFLLTRHLSGDPDALEMATVTLDRMAAGGIHDQLGGGFHRYSTDARWLAPHFEKMLYDNAQLARLYLHAWQVTSTEEYRRVAVATLEYLLRELRHPQGGFFSAQDADSEGEEGKFFVWSHSELVASAGDGGEVLADLFDASPQGNWEGKNVLWKPRPPARVAAAHRLRPEQLADLVEAARPRLLEVRERRPHPATDDKVLAAWNGLAILGLAEAGRVLSQPRYMEAAVAAAEFVLGEMRRADGRLLRAWRQGRTSGPAYVDDYALMAAACLGLYETTFELRWMTEARRLADEMVRLFSDPAGGFFQTGEDAEPLLSRPKDLFDNAVPSGNSVAAEVLFRLFLLTGEGGYQRRAVSALRVVRDLMLRAPSSFGHALQALGLYLGPSREVAVVGDFKDEATRALIEEVWSRHLPTTVLASGRPGDEEAAALVPLLADRPLVGGRPAAYVCERFTCQQPVTDPTALAAQLGS